jgi:hypothetical protein
MEAGVTNHLYLEFLEKFVPPLSKTLGSAGLDVLVSKGRTLSLSDTIGVSLNYEL